MTNLSYTDWPIKPGLLNCVSSKLVIYQLFIISCLLRFEPSIHYQCGNRPCHLPWHDIAARTNTVPCHYIRPASDGPDLRRRCNSHRRIRRPGPGENRRWGWLGMQKLWLISGINLLSFSTAGIVNKFVGTSDLSTMIAASSCMF